MLVIDRSRPHRSRLLVGFLIFIILAILGPSIIFAEHSSDLTEQTVRNRCVIAQNYLQSALRGRDLRVRVDRLQRYQNIHHRVDIFTQRLEGNNQPQAKQFRSITDQFSRLIDAFKRDYETYDESRDKVAKLSRCQDKPSEFIEALDVARQDLQIVEDRMVALDTIINSRLPNQLDTLKAELEESDE